MSGGKPRARPHGQVPTIHGRDRERAVLRELLDDTTAGHAALVLIAGEGGIGKTSLVETFIHDAEQQSCLVLRGNCYDLMTTPPYGPWLELFSRASTTTQNLPAIPPLAIDDLNQPATQSLTAMFEPVLAFFELATNERTAVVVLEDLHWSDPASLDLLRFIVRAALNQRLLLVVTYRDDEITRQSPLYQILPLLIRESQATRLDLRRLDESVVSEMIAARYALDVADHARLVQHVQSLAEGNPLYTTELLRSLEQEQVLVSATGGSNDCWKLGNLEGLQVPALLQQVIDRRLAHLDDETHRALETAAIIGHEVPVEIWRVTSGLSESALDSAIDQAITAHVFEETPNHTGLLFTHALVREALHERIVVTRRRSLHRTVAETLATFPQPDPEPIAHHFQQAADPRALEWLVRAGLRAWRSAAWISAADRFQSAATMLADEPSRTSQCGWLLYMAATLIRYADNETSLELLSQAEALSLTARDELLKAHCVWHQGITRCHHGDIRRGVAELERGVEMLDRRARTQRVLGDEDEAERAIRSLLPNEPDESRPGAGQVPPAMEGTRPHAVIQRGILLNWFAQIGRFREAADEGAAWIPRIQAEFGERYMLDISGLGFHRALDISRAMMGYPNEATTGFRFVRDAAARMGDYFLESLCIYYELLKVVIPYHLDDIRWRKQLIHDVEEKVRRTRNTMTGMTFDILCNTLVDAIEGRWPDPHGVATDQQHVSLDGMAQEALHTQSVVARHQGRTGDAWEWINTSLPDGPATEPGGSLFHCSNPAQRLAAEMSLDAGDLDTARAWLTAHESWLEWSGALVGRAEGEILWAWYFAMLGDIDEACAHALRALEIASEPRQPGALIAAHRMLGDLASRSGHHADAAHHLDLSLDLAGACRAPFERALTLIALSELRIATGDLQAAQDALAEARAICEPLWAAPALERIHRLEAGLMKRTKPPSHPAGLSTREVEVLKLVAQGMSNPDIAERLYISPRTVDRHVSSILIKTDTANRIEATRFAIEHGLA